MKVYKYKFSHQSNTIRLGNLLDDMWQVHAYFHKWQRQRYKDGFAYANYHAMSAHLTVLKRTTHPHWNALPSQAIQCELRRIDNAYQRFFNKLGGRPHIKRKHKFKSITFPGHSGWHLKDNRITLTFRKYASGKWKLDRVPYSFHKHREYHGTIARITIKRDTCGDYWLCITTDFVDTEPLPTTGQSVGGDFGMKDAYLTLSTGEKIQHPQPLKQSLTKLRNLNKALSRKVKGSNGWWRAVRHTSLSETCQSTKDFHWKLATYLCNTFDSRNNLDGMKRLTQSLRPRLLRDIEVQVYLIVSCVKSVNPTSKPCSE